MSFKLSTAKTRVSTLVGAVCHHDLVSNPGGGSPHTVPHTSFITVMHSSLSRLAASGTWSNLSQPNSATGTGKGRFGRDMAPHQNQESPLSKPKSGYNRGEPIPIIILQKWSQKISILVFTVFTVRSRQNVVRSRQNHGFSRSFSFWTHCGNGHKSIQKYQFWFSRLSRVHVKITVFHGHFFWTYSNLDFPSVLAHDGSKDVKLLCSMIDLLLINSGVGILMVI